MARLHPVEPRLDWLDTTELSRHDAIRVPAAQRRFAQSHTLLRWALTQYAPAGDPSSWGYEISERGRPELNQASLERLATAGMSDPIRFNLSHTTDFAAVLLCQGQDCGVDVETTTRATNLDRVGFRSFAAAEYEDFAALSGASQRQRFFEYWTLKESYIKAIGTGLATPLSRFAFAIHDQDATVAFAPELKDNPHQWAFGLHSPTSDVQLGWGLRDGEHGVRQRPDIRWYPTRSTTSTTSTSA